MRYLCHLLIFISTYSWSQQWKVQESYPIFLDDAVGFSIGETGFVGTGRDDGFQFRNEIYYFVNNSWQSCAPLIGIGRQYAASFSFQELGCILTGIGQGDSLFNEMQCFDSYSKVWSIMKDFPGFPRLQASSFSIDNYGYCGGGRNLTVNFADWYKYDVESNSWYRIADFPIEIYEGISFESNGFGYVGLGKDAMGNYNNRMFKYIPFADS